MNRLPMALALLLVTSCSSPPAKEPNASTNAAPNNANAANTSPNSANTTPNAEPNSSSPTVVSPSDFDQSCALDHECQLVWGGDVCGCGNSCADAIAASAVEAFEDAIAAVTCPPNGDPAVCGGACQEQMAVCSSGDCEAAVVQVVEASQFDQSCEVDADCVLVPTGRLCNACMCGQGAINVNALDDHAAAWAAVDCNPGPSPCDCETAEPATCNAGTCAGGS